MIDEVLTHSGWVIQRAAVSDPTLPPPPPPPPPMSVPPPPPPPLYGATPGYYPHAHVYGARPRYAGWWRRVGAAMIDGLISLLFLIPAGVVASAGPTETTRCENSFGLDSFCEGPTTETAAATLILYIIGLVVYFTIYVRMLGRGATWGRKAAGYRILDERTLQPIGTGRAIGRYFAAILSALPCYLGFLWPLWDSENRTFHDMIVKTRAIKNR